eukprot:1748534-Lingulodinium_polyedra.AAC.1
MAAGWLLVRACRPPRSDRLTAGASVRLGAAPRPRAVARYFPLGDESEVDYGSHPAEESDGEVDL